MELEACRILYRRTGEHWAGRGQNIGQKKTNVDQKDGRIMERRGCPKISDEGNKKDRKEAKQSTE
jgi:hypothetical protein